MAIAADITSLQKSIITNDMLDEPGKNRDNVDPQTGARTGNVGRAQATGAGGSLAAHAQRVAPTEASTMSRSGKGGGKQFTVKPDGDIDPVTGLPKNA